MRYRGWRGAAGRNLATTHLLDRIAEDFGETCYEVPVGFKYVLSLIHISCWQTRPVTRACSCARSRRASNRRTIPSLSLIHI